MKLRVYYLHTQFSLAFWRQDDEGEVKEFWFDSRCPSDVLHQLVKLPFHLGIQVNLLSFMKLFNLFWVFLWLLPFLAICCPSLFPSFLLSNPSSLVFFLWVISRWRLFLKKSRIFAIYLGKCCDEMIYINSALLQYFKNFVSTWQTLDSLSLLLLELTPACSLLPCLARIESLLSNWNWKDWVFQEIFL